MLKLFGQTDKDFTSNGDRVIDAVRYEGQVIRLPKSGAANARNML